MRPLEILLPIVLTAIFIWPYTRLGRPEISGLLPTFALLVVITHARVEGSRWQMIPLYVITGLLFLMSLPAYLRAVKPGEAAPAAPRPNAGLTILGLGLLAVATALPILLPVPSLPTPGGPYAIATRAYELIDYSREEFYASIPGQPRRIMVQVWYPAVPPPLGAVPAPWLPEASQNAPLLSDFFKLPKFFFSHIPLAKTHSYNDLPVLPGGPYPVLVFSHGWDGFRQQSTYQMEELASRGYIVLAPDYAYGAMVTRYPNGDVAYNNPAALPKDAPSEQYEIAARKLVAQWSDDIRYTLDYFSAQNADASSPFYQTLNLEKIGAFGHSTGGGATIQFCATDPRCRAGFTEDAFVRPLSVSTLENGTRQPFFYLFSEAWPFARNIELFNQYYSHVSPENRVAILLGTKHYDFSDLPAFSPLAAAMGLKGPLNGARVQQIINTYLVAFFDQTLKGIPSPLLDGTSPDFPELRWELPK
ncbi:MAG: carboxylic ester hydrolase [Anaerolineales bacterium]